MVPAVRVSGAGLGGHPSRALVTLSREGHETIRFRGFGGVEGRVHEIGTQGKGMLVDHAVAYPRRGGTSFWTRAPEGVEEWLHLEVSAVRAGEAVATWQIDDMTARQRGDRVEIVDALGVVRRSVAAPVAYAAEGKLPCASVQDASVNEIHGAIRWTPLSPSSPSPGHPPI